MADHDIQDVLCESADPLPFRGGVAWQGDLGNGKNVDNIIQECNISEIMNKDTSPSLTTPPLNTDAHPTLRQRRNSSVINEHDGRVAEGKALNTDDDNNIEECNISEIMDNSQDGRCGAVLNRGGLISRSNSSSILITQRSLPKDTFSFIIISRLFSLPFLIAIIVFSFQIAIFSLVSVDVIDLDNSRNPFHLPPNVESTVRATQVLAIIIAIVTQDDVKKVILILRDGYIADVFQGTFGPDATKFKWVLSLALRAAEGLIGLFVTFMLIMQSKTVLDLLLNFSAMEFVSLLDDGAFLMLREGYFGIGWSGIFTNQSKGEYLCQRMYIQIDDEFAPALAMLSGIYTINQKEQFGGRVTSSQEKNGQGKIGYCEDENVWTLAIQDPLMPYNPCLGWVAKSSQSFDFEVINTASSQWYAQMSDSGSVAAFIIDVELICAICDNRKNKCLNGGVCQIDGNHTDSNGSCQCVDDATGFFCQIRPTHNGLCNTYFNKPEYNYDGGDCCESSCVSSDTYTCGKDASGIVDIGYSHCNTKTEPYDQWFQSGNPVNGLNVAARSGTSVALIGRGGTVLAVGDPEFAVVHLFDKDGSKWVQRGEALKGPTDSQFGHVISLTSGESENVMMNDYSLPTVTLAVTTWFNDFTSGFVRVYECHTNGCEQVGSDIILYALSVSLSRDGNRLAIGTVYTDDTNFDNPVKVKVYKLDSELQPPDWKMIGNMTDYSPPANQSDLSLSAEAGYGYFYHSLYYTVLSGNGQILVTIKIKFNETSTANGMYPDAKVSYNTHEWNSTIGSWDVMDDKGGLLSKTHKNQFAIIKIDKCLALSDDGTVIAVCSELSIAVYSWNSDKSSWIPRDVIFDLHNLSRTLAVSSVDISADGSTLAIGSEFSVLALKWNGTHYKQHLNSIPSDDEWTSISLSRDGNAMAVGRPLSGGGVTTVYKVRPPGCTGNMKLVRISFTTDYKPDQNRWSLQIGNETIESQPFDKFQQRMTFVKEICVPADVCIKFRVFDLLADGIQDPGGYSVMLDGEEVANGGADFSFVESKHITGDCPTLSCTGNTPDWVDGDGDGCDWYKWNDVPGCELHGESSPAEDDSTAKENCCYCFLGNNPMPSPSITSSASPTASKSQLVQSPPSTG